MCISMVSIWLFHLHSTNHGIEEQFEVHLHLGLTVASLHYRRVALQAGL